MIVNWLARRKWGRVALVPVVIGCGAFSWFSYLDGTPNTQDAARVKGWWGWLSSAMEPQWLRLADSGSPDYGSWFHSTKNIGAEWAKSDPQRAYKALSFILTAGTALAVLEGCSRLVMPLLRIQF